MADDIRKVGIELTAQGAKDFTQSMRDIKGAVSEAYSELKLAQSQYDKNTSAVDKLKDRQKYLGEVTEQYSKKSELLRGELEKMESAENRNEEAIRKKRTELNECEAKLNDYKKSLKDVNNQLETHSAQLKEWGDKIKSVGDKTTEIGKGLTTHVTAPITAVGAASVAAWKEVDGAMDTVTTKTGASGEALADMQQRVKNLAESIPTDFQTAADAVGEVNTRFGLTGDALESLSGDFVKFAQLNDTDVSSSIDSVQSAMAAWGIGAEDASLVLDTMNKAGQDTGISVDKLSDMLKTNKTALDEAGLSFSDSAMLLANMDKNGVDAGTALAGLKKALQNATKEGKPANQALQELQEKMGDGSNKAEAYAAATELFGAKAGPAIADACMEGRLSFDQLGTSMGDFAGNVESTFNETVDPLDQMQMSMNTMKDLGSEIVEAAAPMLVDAMTAIRDIIVDLKEKWEGLSPEQQEMIIKIAAIAAAVGPLLVILGTVISMIGTIVGAIGGVAAIMGAPLLGPIALIVAAVLGIIAIGMTLADNWDWIKQKAAEFVENIKQKWDEFKAATVEKFEALKEGAKQKIYDMIVTILGKIGAFKEGVRERIQAIKDGVVQRFEDLKEGAKQKIYDMVVTVLGKIGALKDGARERIQDMKDAITQKFTDIKESAVQKFEDIKRGITDKIDAAKDTVRRIVDDIKGFFDFDWSLPELKLPHISISEYMDVPGLGTIPAPWGVHVDWYAKAYDSPYLLTNPTVMNGRGFGDRGSHNGGELVYSHDKLMDDIRRASGGGTFAPVINVYTQEGQSNEAIANYVMEKLTREYQRAARYV